MAASGDKPLLKQLRGFLKDSIRKQVDFAKTDQSRGVLPPALEKPCAVDQKIIDLVGPEEWPGIPPFDLKTAITNRRSRRAFLRQPLSLEELSFLLWATQGVVRRGKGNALRTVPSAGARHALETYICALSVE